MLKVLNNIEPIWVTDPDFAKEIETIKFKCVERLDTRFRTFDIESIITFDVECSNGYSVDGNVIGMDKHRFNLGYRFSKTIDMEKYLKDKSYREEIDSKCPDAFKYYYKIEYKSVPVSLLYVWQCAVEDGDNIKIFMGRNYDELLVFFFALSAEARCQCFYGYDPLTHALDVAAASEAKGSVKMKIAVHNLGYEFQTVLRNIFSDEFSKKGHVFARSARKPMYARANINRVNVEFYDTLILVNQSLKQWCSTENLPVKKLDEEEEFYDEIRTPLTKLSEESIRYSVNDVVCMCYGIEKFREKYGSLRDNIRTSTGAIRRVCKKKVAAANPQWRELCYNNTVSYSFELFTRLLQCFCGGWTHTNALHTGDIFKCICYDIASSYPTVMCTRTMPIGPFEKVDVSLYDELISQDLDAVDLKYHYFLRLKLKNVKAKLFNTFWSNSKVELGSKITSVDNGRIERAEEMTFTIIDTDWEIFRQAYDFDEDIEVLELWRSESGFMAKEFILTVLEAYGNKTKLKGLEDEISLSKYKASKEIANGCYGMECTKIVTDDIIFSKDAWDKIPCDSAEFFYEKIGETKEEDSFGCYQHAPWITGWARFALWSMILKIDKHLYYADTDSLKGCFTEEEIAMFDEYNEKIAERQKVVADILGIDESLYHPKTIKGEEKRLGVYEQEHTCYLKALGAKRYVTQDIHDGKIECTIAGLPKKAGVKVVKKLEDFADGIEWDYENSMKKTAIYNDNQPICTWTDSDGVSYTSTEYDKCGICIKPATFKLSLTEEYDNFIKFIQMGRCFDTEDIVNDTPSMFFN